MKIILNATRYSTSDLEQIIAGLLSSALALQFIAPTDRELIFIEYTPEKGQTIPHPHRKLRAANSGASQVETVFPYARVGAMNVIQLAAPESWVSSLELLALPSPDAMVSMPRVGIYILTALLNTNNNSIGMPAHFHDLRVAANQPPPDPNISSYIIKYVDDQLRIADATMRTVVLIQAVHSVLAAVKYAQEQKAAEATVHAPEILVPVIAHLQAKEDRPTLEWIIENLSSINVKLLSAKLTKE